ncbi:MAG: hypothetical protein L6V93_22925 [Clostridiales bacterium]|nr:MAG: hypothetical protein L6V93_22925 [Clostridiales bacterium]
MTLTAALDNDTQSKTTGNVGLSFKVENNSGKDENVSIRLLLDTALGNRIDAPYFVLDKNLQPTMTETEFAGGEVPYQIRSLDSLTNPTRLSYILMEAQGWNGGTKPNKVILGHWAKSCERTLRLHPQPELRFYKLFKRLPRAGQRGGDLLGKPRG